MIDKNIKKLKNFIKFTERNKSSHWKKYLNSKSDIKNIYSSMGFGSYSKKKPLKKIIHYILARIVFGKNIFLSNSFNKYKKIFDKNGRQIDVDTIRHIYTFKLLAEKLKLFKIKKICLIGDGKLNGIIGCLSHFPNAKIYSINLAETLINDYLICKNMKLIKIKNIQVVNNANDLKKSKKLFLLPSHLKKLLFKKKVDLFINIASFQEMKYSEIKKYFNIIKSNKSYLYCANREHKRLPDNKNIYFSKYPWGHGKKIILGDCKWHQKFYNFSFPFVKKYEGNIKHCLIYYN
jgi:putative sugar O-methyltransferase